VLVKEEATDHDITSQKWQLAVGSFEIQKQLIGKFVISWDLRAPTR